HLPEGDGVVAAVTATQLRALVDRCGAKHLGSSTRELVAHTAAVAEAVGEDVRIVDAVVVLDQLLNVVDELQILAALIGPACIEAIRSDEESTVLGQLLEPEMGHVVAVRATSIDFLRAAAVPVKAEVQGVGVALV